MAIDFPGAATDVINCGSDISIDNFFSGGATAMGWMKLDAFEPYFDNMFSKASPGNVGDSFNGWGFGSTGYSSWDTIYFDQGFKNASTVQSWRGPIDDMVTGIWYYLAVTYNSDAKANVPIFYINGVSVTVTETQTFGGPGVARDDSAYDLRIGNNNYSTPEVVNGEFSDLRLYNRILSADEIETIYACEGHDEIIEGLVSRWKLDERNPGVTPSGAGVIIDCIGNNNGTPGGTIQYSEDVLSLRKRA